MTDHPCQRISMAELDTMLNQDQRPVLLDVRNPDEYLAGCIEGAVLLPCADVARRAADVLPRDGQMPVVTYCAAGPRAMRAAAELQRLGYRQVYAVDGGFGDWQRSGRPWITPDSDTVPGGLRPEQLQRYARHLRLPEIGTEGQARLLNARVLCVGAGGLGSPAAIYLAAAGVGRLSIVDDDTVELSNLHRQIVHPTSRVGLPKTDSAAATLGDINPDTQVSPVRARLGTENAAELLKDHDVIVDGSDNFATRYVVNDTAVKLGIPVVHAAIQRFDGQVTSFAAAGGPCYRCLFPEPPPPDAAPSCAEAGVLGVLPGVLGVLQATEAVKIILGIGEPLYGQLLIFDALSMNFSKLKFRADPRCRVCGQNKRGTVSGRRR